MNQPFGPQEPITPQNETEVAETEVVEAKPTNKTQPTKPIVPPNRPSFYEFSFFDLCLSKILKFLNSCSTRPTK